MCEHATQTHSKGEFKSRCSLCSEILIQICKPYIAAENDNFSDGQSELKERLDSWWSEDSSQNISDVYLCRKS